MKVLRLVAGRSLRMAIAPFLFLATSLHSAFGQGADPWAGWMQCDIVAEAVGYQSRQIHTWLLTEGAPLIRSGNELRAATWSVSGGGSLQSKEYPQTWVVSVPPTPAPLNTLIRASDGRRLFQAGHSQLQAPNALTITAQPLAARGPSTETLTVFEWQFPVVDDAGDSATLTGSTKSAFTLRLDRMQPASGAQGNATCTWYFSKSEKVPAPPGSDPLRTSDDSAPRSGLRAGIALPTGTSSPAPAAATAPAAPATAVISPRATSVGATTIDGANGAALIAVTPTGPPPQIVSITGLPLVAQIRWKGEGDITTYELYRSAGSETPAKVWSDVYYADFAAEYVDVRDVVPDYRPGYLYRVVARYSNGTWGEATTTFVSPPLTNPTGFRAAQTLPSDVVTLQWDPTPGAVQYRIDGSGLDVNGKYVAETTVTISPITSGGSWQLAAIYPGNYADYAKRPVATVIPLPAHAPAWLSKHGTGSAAEAASHYSHLCGSQVPSCNTLQEYLLSWATPSVIAGGGREDLLVKYDNLTDLGSPRETTCFFGGAMPGGGALICYANTGNAVSLIVMSKEGARFATFERAKGDDAYSNAWAGATPIASATFDTEGPKFAPHACLACHGGTYDAATGLVQGATLLPIDPGLVQISGDRNAAEEKIRAINSIIRRSVYSSGPVAAYIEGLYGGMVGTRRLVDEPDTHAIADYVPQGWTQQRSLYLDFVKKDCAICHLATASNLDFLSAGNFMANKDLIHTSVCKSHSMPHAQTAYINFWTSGNSNASGPGYFAAALGFSGCP
jgi:hypothetical protein